MDSPEPEPPSGYVARPDYRIGLLARTNLMTARLGDAQLAASEECLVVDEQDHALVVYFPPGSVDFSLLEPVDLHTRCPFKGQASYWRAPGHDQPWVAWSYPTPYPQVARITGYVAFDQGTVSVAIGT